MSVKEQSINLTDTLQSVDNIVLNAYLRFIGVFYAPNVDATTSFDLHAFLEKLRFTVFLPTMILVTLVRLSKIAVYFRLT